MKKHSSIFYYIIIFCSIIGCSHKKQNKGIIDNAEKYPVIPINHPVKATLISDSIVLVDLGKNISFHWNNNSYRIVRDSLYQGIIENFLINEPHVITSILSTVESPAIICCSDDQLKIGDLAFLLLYDICKIPHIEILGYQLDMFCCDFTHPHGVIQVLSLNRIEIYEKLTNSKLELKKRRACGLRI